MQLGIAGQYFFMMNVGGFTGGRAGLAGAINGMINMGASNNYALEGVYIKEEALGNLPTLTVRIRTFDPTLMSALNEGAPLYIQFGMTPETAIPIEFMAVKNSYGYTDGGLKNNGSWSVECKAVLSSTLKYMRDSKQQVFKNLTSKDAIKKCAGEFFNVVDNCTYTPQDKMNWIKPGVSPYRFVHKTLERSYISDDNFLLHGIDMRNNFKICSIKDLASSPPLITAVPPGFKGGFFGNTYEYTPNEISVHQESGPKNHFAGLHKRKYQTYDPLTEKTKVVETKPFNSYFISGCHNVSAKVPEKTEYPHVYDKRCLHKNWDKARLCSAPGASQFTSLVIDNIILEHKYVDVGILQNISFITPEAVNGKCTSPVAPYPMVHPCEGYYMVANVTRFFAKDRHVTKLAIARDGLNGMKDKNLFDKANEAINTLGTIGNVLGGLL